jgi:phage tail-like protein
MTNGAEVLLRHLPEVFHSSEDLQILLAAFGEVLFGAENSNHEGLEQIINNIPNLFDPDPGQMVSESTLVRTPHRFLPWLSEWVALGQLQNVPEEECRKLISRIVPLYSSRGTKRYLEKILELFFPDEIQASINDKELPSMKIGQSRIGKETRLGGDIPFSFFVELRFKTKMDEQSQQHKQFLERVRSVIDLAKPAHTAYQLECF